MLSFAAIAAFFSGAKRWFNREAIFALAIGAAVLAVVLGVAAVHGAGKSAGGAAAKAGWLSKINAWNVMQAQRRARMAAQAAEAEAQAREVAEKALEAERVWRLALEAELAKVKDDPEIFSADERRKLFRR